MKKKYIQLPQGYLSYSQLMLWLSDQNRYKQIYFDKRHELSTSNVGQEYGKVVATALEEGIETNDLLTDSAILLLEKYDLRDKEIRGEIKTKEGWIEVMGRPDTMDSKTKNFREYKTGKSPWTKSRAQNHPQMRFYAMLIYVVFGIVLKNALLDWIETEPVEIMENGFLKKSVKPTGRVESFEVTFTLQDILDTMASVSKVAKEIEIAWATHVPDPKLAW